MENWTLQLSLIPSLAVILTSTSRMTLGLSDELTNMVKTVGHDPQLVQEKLEQIKRLSLAGVFMYLSMAVLVVAVLFNGAGWIDPRWEDGAMLIAVAIFFMAIVIKVRFSYFAYFIRQRQFAGR
ncbi:MAG TPA: hypothetical protein PKE21_14505 [Flavobacteriales bacterium]|nr:hypothetical protein [Flavobacteriales bacterium]HMR28691.1 hypothetical protein [Flavobacteriales bacterium]